MKRYKPNKYTIKELKQNEFWVRCSGADATKLVKAMSGQDTNGSEKFYKFDKSFQYGSCISSSRDIDIEDWEDFIEFNQVIW